MSRKIGTAIANLQHGAEDEAWGFVKNVTVEPDPEIENHKNAAGDTDGLIITDEKMKFSGTFEPITGGTGLPTIASALIGTELTFKESADGGSSTITVIIEKASYKREKGAISEMSFEGHNYPNVALT